VQLGAQLGAHLGVGMVLRLASATATDVAHPMTVRAGEGGGSVPQLTEAPGCTQSRLRPAAFAA
jgi:hypothetical protein